MDKNNRYKLLCKLKKEIIIIRNDITDALYWAENGINGEDKIKLIGALKIALKNVGRLLDDENKLVLNGNSQLRKGGESVTPK